jgi:hypothetical protein
MHVIERTIDEHGQRLLVPKIELRESTIAVTRRSLVVQELGIPGLGPRSRRGRRKWV